MNLGVELAHLLNGSYAKLVIIDATQPTISSKDNNCSKPCARFQHNIQWSDIVAFTSVNSYTEGGMAHIWVCLETPVIVHNLQIRTA